jgi:hypothetical protein
MDPSAAGAVTIGGRPVPEGLLGSLEPASAGDVAAQLDARGASRSMSPA